MIEIRKAKRTESKLRIGLAGPSGSGKTYSAIRIGMALAKACPPGSKPGAQRVIVIDTERESADLYANEQVEEGPMDFDVIPMPDHRIETFTAAIKAAASAGYDVLVIDSFTHAWSTILAKKDAMQGNSWTNWAKVTPLWDALVDAVLRFPGHVICCLRSKMEHTQIEQNGTKQVVKLGMGAVVRDGMEYEFTVFADMEHATNRLIVSKTRCSALAGTSWIRPGADFAAPLLAWLAGADTAPKAAGGREPAFVSAIEKLGHDYDRVREWVIESGDSDPDTMAVEDRRKLYAALKTPDVRAAFTAWLDARDAREGA